MSSKLDSERQKGQSSTNPRIREIFQLPEDLLRKVDAITRDGWEEKNRLRAAHEQTRELDIAAEWARQRSGGAGHDDETLPRPFPPVRKPDPVGTERAASHVIDQNNEMSLIAVDLLSYMRTEAILQQHRRAQLVDTEATRSASPDQSTLADLRETLVHDNEHGGRSR